MLGLLRGALGFPQDVEVDEPDQTEEQEMDPPHVEIEFE